MQLPLLAFSSPRMLRLGDRLLDLHTPQVVGILNLTPDSFYDGGKIASLDQALQQAEQLLAVGAAILDIGGMSTRPGAKPISVEEELNRVMPVVEALRKAQPDAFLSVDTVHSQVAAEALMLGVHLINDVSGGKGDEEMLQIVGKLKGAYIYTHSPGPSETMQQLANYDDVVTTVYDDFIAGIHACHAAGIKEIVLDPGFGFGKTLLHNYQLLGALHTFSSLGLPIMAGVSRKSMVYKPLNLTAQDALNGTTVIHTLALLQGASLLRVHDVAEAQQTIQLVGLYQQGVQSTQAEVRQTAH